MADLGYRPNNLSVGLRRQRSDLLSLILPWNNPELMDTVEQEAFRHGFRVMVNFTTHPDASREISTLDYALDWHVDGIIWLPFADIESYPPRLLERLRDSNVKTIFLQRRLPEMPGSLLGIDYKGGIRKMIAHLASRYRKILYVSTKSWFELKNQRKQFLAEEMQKYDIEYEPISLSTECGFAGEIAAILESRRHYPMAMVCDIDWMALDALEVARRMQIDIPRQLGVVTIGDHRIGGYHHLSDITYPKLSALRVDYHLQGIKAVQNIVKMINQHDCSEDELLPVSLIIRDSVIN